MEDAYFKWAEEVSSSEHEAKSLDADVRDVTVYIDSLISEIILLGTVRFDDDVEDYEILEKARGLWDLVSSSIVDIRRSLNDAGRSIHDLRSAVRFYRP